MIPPSPRKYGYKSSLVAEKLVEMKEFKWNDPFSASLLLQAGLPVEEREEQQL